MVVGRAGAVFRRLNRSGPPRPKDSHTSMSQVGSNAPDHALNDQFGRKVSLSQFKGKSHVLLLFYPLDWTPT